MQLSLTVLLRYRSRVVFRVGCWCHPGSRGVSGPRYSGYAQSPSPLSPTGLSPSTALRSRRLRVAGVGCASVQNSTSPGACRAGIRIALFRFRSPLLTESRLISFPPLSRMLHSSGFPFLTERQPKLSGFQFGDPRIRVSLRLPVAFRSLARPSSAPEPSHPPDGVTVVKRLRLNWHPGLRMHRPSSQGAQGAPRARPLPRRAGLAGCMIVRTRAARPFEVTGNHAGAEVRVWMLTRMSARAP